MITQQFKVWYAIDNIDSAETITAPSVTDAAEIFAEKHDENVSREGNFSNIHTVNVMYQGAIFEFHVLIERTYQVIVDASLRRKIYT